MVLKAVDVRDGPYVALGNECLHRGGSEALHVHGVLGREIRKGPGILCRAGGACAAEMSAVSLPFRGSAAHRADLGHLKAPAALGAQLLYHAEHLRDYVPGLLHSYGVSYPYVLVVYVVLVVQRGAGHRSLRQPHRLKDRQRRHPSGTAHLHHYVLNDGLLLLRRILVGHRPAGHLGGKAQDLSLSKVVHLYHGSVQTVIESPSDLSYVLYGGPDLLRR